MRGISRALGLGWLALLAVLLALAWGLSFAGGPSGPYAWMKLVMLLGPPLGAATFLLSLLLLVLRREPTLPRLVGLALGAFAFWPFLWKFGLAVVPYPSDLEHTRPAATIRWPFDRPARVFWGGDRPSQNYHVTAPDQRWAYDLVIEPAMTGASSLEDYGCWGVPVLAPIDGVVAVAHDGEPDIPPGPPSGPVKELRGNHVALRLDTGTYLLLAHLQRGSVSVSPGQRVKEGQPVGRCGNSGNTSEPHLHLHHQRDDPSTKEVGFSEGLPLFFRDTDGPPMPTGGYSIVDGHPVPRGPRVSPRPPGGP